MDEFRPLGRFSARDRIRKRSEFRAIQDAGHRVVSRGFVFLLGRSPAPASTSLASTSVAMAAEGGLAESSPVATPSATAAESHLAAAAAVAGSKGEAPGRCRLGVTASRRVGNAVQRNRAKRLTREAFRCVRGHLPAGLDLVVIVRHGLGDRKLADVVSEWQSCRARIERRFAELPVPSPHHSARHHSSPGNGSPGSSSPANGSPGNGVREALAAKNSC